MADTALSPWDSLKVWLGKRHDYFEGMYKETNYSIDASELGAYRACYQAMLDIEKADAKFRNSQSKSIGVQRPFAGGG